MAHTRFEAIETDPLPVESDEAKRTTHESRAGDTDGSGAARRLRDERPDSPAASGVCADDSGRRFECLACGRHCETFLADCPDCGEAAFGTAVETPDTTGLTDNGGVLAALVARLHPSVPR